MRLRQTTRHRTTRRAPGPVGHATLKDCRAEGTKGKIPHADFKVGRLSPTQPACTVISQRQTSPPPLAFIPAHELSDSPIVSAGTPPSPVSSLLTAALPPADPTITASTHARAAAEATAAAAAVVGGASAEEAT